MITLWTFQLPFVWQRLQQQGWYRPNWSEVKMAGPNWCIAYDWMIHQLHSRQIQHDLEPPIWAWHSYEGWRKAPGQKCADALYNGGVSDFVCIEFQTSQQHVLLSEYGAWNDIIDCAFDAYRDGRALEVKLHRRSEISLMCIELSRSNPNASKFKRAYQSYVWNRSRE